MKNKAAINPELIYNQLFVLFVGVLSFIILAFYGNTFLNNANLKFIVDVLNFLIFGSFFYLTVNFAVYYSTKASRRIRESYSKLSKLYWGLLISVFIIIVLVFGYFFVDWKTFTGTIFSALLLAGLGAIVWLAKPYIEKKLNK